MFVFRQGDLTANGGIPPPSDSNSISPCPGVSSNRTLLAPDRRLYFPRVSFPFYFFASLGFPLLSTNQANKCFFAGVLISAKFSCQNRPYWGVGVGYWGALDNRRKIGIAARYNMCLFLGGKPSRPVQLVCFAFSRLVGFQI